VCACARARVCLSVCLLAVGVRGCFACLRVALVLTSCVSSASYTVSRCERCREDGPLPRVRSGRVPGRGAREAFIRRDTCVTMCGTARAPSLGGILLSVRVSRKDDNAHGIAVASCSAQRHRIASAPTRGRGIVVSRARFRPETRAHRFAGCACVLLQPDRLTTERLHVDLIYVLRMVPSYELRQIGELGRGSRAKLYRR
jgi:hypothetical protein